MEFKNLLEIVQDEPVFDTGLLLAGDVNSREIRRQLSASYVSLQSALAYYGMIPEHVPVTTSVSTSRPARWETTLGIYDFRHIQIPFFDGFRVVDLGEQQQAFIAIPEKALLDLIYLEPGGDTLDYLAELRLSNLDMLDWQILGRLARKIQKPKLLRAVATIQVLAEEEGDYESL
jgi:hypothetical protein